MITIKNQVRVGKKRLFLIEKVTQDILKDLNLKKVIIYISPAAEMPSVDGYCLGKTMIDIKNSRSFENVVDTIAHEIRHCWQHVTGKDNKGIRWMEYDAEKYAMKQGKVLCKKYNISTWK